MEQKRNGALWSKFGLLMVTLVWGSSFVVVKNATSSLSPSWIIVERFGLASAALILFMLPKLKKIGRTELKAGFYIAFWTALGYELQTYGVQYTTAGNNAFLTAIYCIVVPFLFWLFRRVRPNRYQIISAFLCIFGVGLLSLHGGVAMNAGDVLSLLCGLCFAMQIIVIDKYAADSDPMIIVLLQLAFTALLALPVALFFEKAPSAVKPESIFSILYLGIVGTMLASAIQFACQKRVEPSSASLIMSLESVFGTLCGVIFLHEPMTLRTFLGCAIIFGAICLSELSTGRQPDAARSRVQ